MPHQTLIESPTRQANGTIEVRRATFQDDANAVQQGIVLAGFKKLADANRDPRMERSHRQVLTNIAEHISYQTGTAFPDWRVIAAEEGLNERTVQNTLYELRQWGYLIWEKRASPEQHTGRLRHYTLPIISYSREDMIAGIEEWCREMRREIPRPWCKNSTPPMVQIGGISTAHGAKSYTADGVKKSPAHGVNSPPAVQKSLNLHRPRGDRNNNSNNNHSRGGLDAEARALVDRAVDLYNRYAERDGFRHYNTRNDTTDRRLHARLLIIGGLDKLELALSVIRTVDFYMGRVPPRGGQRPFRMHIDFLLSEGSGSGDVLAGLIDQALDKPAPSIAPQPRGRLGR